MHVVVINLAVICDHALYIYISGIHMYNYLEYENQSIFLQFWNQIDRVEWNNYH